MQSEESGKLNKRQRERISAGSTLWSHFEETGGEDKYGFECLKWH